MSNEIGIIGCVSSSIFFSSPIITIYELYHNKQTVKKISGVHLFLCYLNCLIWFAIGLRNQNDQFYWSNLVGAVLNFVWCMTYLNFYTNGKKFLFFVYAFSLLDISVELLYFEYLLLEETNIKADLTWRTNVVEWVFSICVNLFMYLTPGFNLIKLFKTKDHEMIRITSVIPGLGNSGIWFAYGLSSSQEHVSVSNGIAICICSIQIFLYYYYQKLSVNNGDNGDSKDVKINRM